MLFFALLAAEPVPDCKNTSIQLEIAECALIEWRKADAELNRQWKVTLATVKRNGEGAVSADQTAEYLLKAQRAWITYREAHCDSLHPYTMRVQLDYSMNVWCQTALTQARIEELRELEKAYRD
jgi:uncharacterized protein YecT (DUF1311 family)